MGAPIEFGNAAANTSLPGGNRPESHHMRRG
jgi:hypothetical protein